MLRQVIIAFAVVSFIIGVHQSVLVGFGQSYWIFMFSILFYLSLKFVKTEEEKPAPKAKKVVSTGKKTKKK